MKLQMPFRKFECWKGIKQSVLEKFAKSYEIGQFLGQTAPYRKSVRNPRIQLTKSHSEIGEEIYGQTGLWKGAMK